MTRKRGREKEKQKKSESEHHNESIPHTHMTLTRTKQNCQFQNEESKETRKIFPGKILTVKKKKIKENRNSIL